MFRFTHLKIYLGFYIPHNQINTNLIAYSSKTAFKMTGLNVNLLQKFQYLTCDFALIHLPHDTMWPQDPIQIERERERDWNMALVTEPKKTGLLIFHKVSVSVHWTSGWWYKWPIRGGNAGLAQRITACNI